MRTRSVRAGAILGALGLALLAVGVGGCFDAPEIEDQWTRLDIEGSTVTPNQALTAGTMVPITVSTAITYRAIRTGFAVVELRASSTVPATSVAVHPDAPRVQMAQDIDRILLSSVTRGRAVRAVTGWDHLIQRITFTFDGQVPAAGDSAATGGGLFLLCYMGSGERVERQGMADTIIVTPFNSTQYEILPVGMSLVVAP